MDGMKSFAQAIGFVLMAEFAWMQFNGDRALTLHEGTRLAIKVEMNAAMVSGVMPALGLVVVMHWREAYLRGQAQRKRAAEQQGTEQIG